MRRELIALDARSGKVLRRNPLSGSPDVVFFDRVHKHLYVAVGNPGTIDVFDTKSMEKLGTVATEKGAHTFVLVTAGDGISAFLPQSHRAAFMRKTEARQRNYALAAETECTDIDAHKPKHGTQNE